MYQFYALPPGLSDDQPIVRNARVHDNDVDPAFTDPAVQSRRQAAAQRDLLRRVHRHRRLDQEINVTATAAVIGTRPEQQDPTAARQDFPGCPADAGFFCVGQPHRTSIASEVAGAAGRARLGLGAAAWLLRPDPEALLLDGSDLFALQGVALRAVQIIFQDPLASLNTRMRAAQILDEGPVALQPQTRPDEWL